MLPRIRTWTLGTHASARCYSTLGGPSGSSSGFLSDLMKRIDTINLKTEKIAQTQTQAKPAQVKQKSASGAQKQQKKAVSSPKKTPVFAAKAAPVKAKIAIKDHPLSSNMFKLMDEKNFSRSSRSGPRQPAKNGANVQGRTQPRTQNFGDRRPGARRSGPNKKAPFTQRKPRFVQPASIVPKKLQSAALKPAVNGDLFLHGKPAKLGVSTSSRVAAVAKECLLKSQYPYKLPKSIIDNLDETFSGNKFLLQKNFDLNVDQQHFEDRVRKVVRGETEKLAVSPKPSPAEQDTHRGLVANGSLSMENKQIIYDVVTGLKSAQDLLKNAAWNK